MPGYIDKILKRFCPHYRLPTHRPAQTPGRYTIPVYSKIQYANVDDSPSLAPDQRTELQAIIGTLLYYARAVDPTLLPIANELASQQASPTVRVFKAINRALSYAAGNPSKCTTFYYCDIYYTVTLMPRTSRVPTHVPSPALTFSSAIITYP